MNNVTISIIVPAYNIENYISRCLDSLLRQEYQRLEIIVVDDGSTDDTGKIIDQYATIDSRIIPIHKDNGGVSSARLAGIRRATGTYIGFVDGDDYVESDMYKHLLMNAIKYQADISHCGYKMVFPDGREDEYYGTGKIVEQNREQALIALLSGDYVEPGLWNKLYRASIVFGFTEEKSWNPEIKINEDLLMNYLLFKRANKFIYEDKTFYHYILRKGSAATSKIYRYQIIDSLKVMELIKEDTTDNKVLVPIVYDRYLRVLISIVMQTSWKEEAKEAKRKLKKEIICNNLNFCLSMKLKFMVIGVVYFEPLYRVVRLFYEKVTRISKKYEVE